MAALETHLFPCLSDSYGLLVHDPESGETLAVDAPDGEAVMAALGERGWRLTCLLITHHHADHVDGLPLVKAETGAVVVGPEADAGRVAGLEQRVREGSMVRFAGRDILTIETPGHTAGHVAYWIPDDGLAFVGDTLFALGCGRIFEGSAQEMWRSLTKLAELPPSTQVFCGHEYTLSNGRFALSVDPDNEALKARMAVVEALAAQKRPTIPTTIAEEHATNPFLRAGRPELARSVDLEGAPAVEVFAALREAKNRG